MEHLSFSKYWLSIEKHITRREKGRFFLKKIAFSGHYKILISFGKCGLFRRALGSFQHSVKSFFFKH